MLENHVASVMLICGTNSNISIKEGRLPHIEEIQELQMVEALNCNSYTLFNTT